MPTRRLSGIAVAASEPDNGGDNSGGGGSGGPYTDDVFSAYLYSASRPTLDVENGIDLAGEGGMVWIKSRNIAGGGNIEGNHALFDTERGTGNGLKSNTTDEAGTHSDDDNTITSYNSDGFSIGYSNAVNSGGAEYVSWTFRKKPKFFTVVTYTGNGASDFSYRVPHNLGCQPGLVIFKNVSASSDWMVWTERCWGSGHNLILNTDDADSGSNEANGRGYVDPNDDYDLLPVATGTGVNANKLNDEYVAYVFAHDDSDESMIKCGSYTGNQAAGNEVDLGFEPQFVLIKAASGEGEWYMFDTMRGIFAGDFDPFLRANMNAVESASSEQLEANPTGFSLSADINVNKSGIEYIYMAIRRPSKPAEEFEREELFSSINEAPSSLKSGLFEHPHLADFSFYKFLSGAQQWGVQDRLRGEKDLSFDTSGAEGGFVNGNKWDVMEGYINAGPGAGAYSSWAWRRAPGHMDSLCYEGDGVNGREVDHNLGVMPEMVIHKHRSHDANWTVWHHQVSGPGREWWEYGGNLNEDYAFGDKNSQQSDPTSSTWPVESGWTNVAGRTNVLYLFASTPGISKVGSYTGSSENLTIDCGFTNGARWLLVKRTDAAGDWVIYFPSNSGDPLKYTHRLNNDSQFVSQYDLIPDPVGFLVSTSSESNIDGAEYIFYAIAE